MELLSDLKGNGGVGAAPRVTITDASGHYTATDVELALAEVGNHMFAILDAHIADAISFTPTGTVAATNVQAAIAEVAAEAVSGTVADNAVTNVKLADMAQATIKGRASASGTGDPVDLTAAQVRAIAAYTASLINITDVSGYYVQTNVENALAEVMTRVIDTESSISALDTTTTGHLTGTTDVHDASAISILDTGALYTATQVEAALAEAMNAINTVAARVATKITVAGTAPGSPAVNDLWVDTT